MKPAASVIAFTTLSGAGFGLIAFLALGLPAVTGWSAFGLWFLAYALAVGGLASSVLHLARPSRARHALSQWSSSWLSREGLAAIAALVAAAPLAIGEIFLSRQWLGLGLLVAALCVLTVLSTGMIYAQLRAVPRWNMAFTPLLYLMQALAGGALLAGQGWTAAALLLGLGAVQLWTWRRGDMRYAELGATLASATGQPEAAQMRLFERSHTARDWVMDEMAGRIGRKHRETLRILGFVLLSPAPAIVVALAPASLAATALAVLLHLIGALACRWLFFAEAEHVVGLYYGR